MIEMSSPDTDEITGTFLKNRFEVRFKFTSSRETWLFKMVDNKFIFPSKKSPLSSTKKDKMVDSSVLVFDSKNGNLLAKLDGDSITAIRTGAASGIATNLTLFYYSFFWEFTPLNILTIGVTLFLTPFVGILISPYLAGRFGKRNTIICMFLFAFIAENIAIFLLIFDLMPSNDTPYVLAIVLVCHWIAVAAQIISYTTLGSMVFDTVEEVEKITGRRMEGTLLAARSFAAKCMSGAGAFLAGIILTISSWPSGAVPGEVASETIVSVAIYVLSISTALWLLALFVFSRVRMTKASHENNLDNLNYSES